MIGEAKYIAGDLQQIPTSAHQLVPNGRKSVNTFVPHGRKSPQYQHPGVLVPVHRNAPATHRA
jgi:hypothetical protein